MPGPNLCFDENLFFSPKFAFGYIFSIFIGGDPVYLFGERFSLGNVTRTIIAWTICTDWDAFVIILFNATEFSAC